MKVVQTHITGYLNSPLNSISGVWAPNLCSARDSRCSVQVELGRLVLKRFLLLVLLLDKAALGSPKEAPMLFRRGQPLKSSAEVCDFD